MIAIIGAMEEEVAEILKQMDSYQEKKISNIQFYEGMMANKEVVLMQSGVGKVLSALSTTVLFEHFTVDTVINIGTAGGLQEENEVLDVIIASKVAQFDMDLTPFGYFSTFDEARITVSCDQDLINLAYDVMANQNDRVFVGPMVTSDQFVFSVEQVEEIKLHFEEALCADMEAGAIGMVCRHYQCPFIVIRSLSDIVLHKDNHLTFEEYVSKASARSAMWCRKIVEAK